MSGNSSGWGAQMQNHFNSFMNKDQGNPRSEYSTVRKGWNFIADNIISKPIEGVQVVGYIFYGSFYLAPKEMYKQGKMENLHVPMNMKLYGFKNGSWGKTLNYIDGKTVMSEEEKYEKIAIPGIEAMTAGVSFGFKPFTQFGLVADGIGNWGFNTCIKTGVKKGIYQSFPKN